MASVELVSVRKQYGSTEVIHGIDLAIADREFVALVGPSGCGKSTLLRMIAGLEAITGGEVRIGGKVVNGLNPSDRDIAMVFQNYALYPHMSVAQNMGFHLRLAGRPKDEIQRRVADAARILGLTELLERRPNELSGGQRQRVAMGRAVIRNPAVFLFDEPLSNLDAKLRVHMRAEIKLLHQKVRTTSIYVTHDQIEAMTLADRVVVLNKGRIEQQGTPLELYRTPVNIFVAGFIGSPAMNILEAVATVTSDGPQAKLPGGAVLDISQSANVGDGQPILVGLRPEHLQVSSGPAPLSGVARLVEPTGAQTHVLLTLAGQDVTAVTDGESTLQIGAPLHLSINREQVHVFDRQTQARLN